MTDPEEQVLLPPINARQLNTIIGALQVSLVRYPLLLQLHRWAETCDPLEHDDVRVLRDMLEGVLSAPCR